MPSGLGFWQGMERASANALNTGMGLVQMQRENRINNEKMEMLRENNDLQKRKAQLEIEAEEKNRELLPVSEVFRNLGINRPSEQQVFLKHFGAYTQKSPATGQLLVERQNLYKIRESGLKDERLNIELDTARAIGALQDIQAIDTQLSDPKLKPEQARALQEQRKAFVIEYTAAENYLNKVLKADDGGTPNKIELTRRAMSGDADAQALLDKIREDEVNLSREKGQAGVEGKLAGLNTSMDIEGAAQAVLEGRETIENVKNTFGVPIQEKVRAAVLAKDPNFNFVTPRAQYASIKSSLQTQQKNRGMMGSFVKNINGQVDKLEDISKDIVKRVGIRAIDLPMRELVMRFKGSGQERVLDAYMKEVSAEIAKLASGSAASVAQLPEANRQEWERIHDPNLSFKELLIILNSTREMANIRLQSVDDEINETLDQLININERRRDQGPSMGDTADPLGILD